MKTKTRAGASAVAPETFLGGSPGRVLLANGFDVGALRTNGLLRKDEWKQLDDAMISVAQRRLSVVATLQARGLVQPLGSLGVLLSEFERLGEMTEAEQSMSAVTAGEFDVPDFDLRSVPIPLTFKDYNLDIRSLQASRMRGSTLDTTSVELATRRVTEKLEYMTINGSSVVVSGSRAYGFRNFPDRLTGNLTADWALTNTTGAQILGDVLTMIKAAEAKNYYGPYVLFVGTAYNAKLREDFKAESDKTIRERLLEIDALEDIQTSAMIPDGDVILVQLTRDVVDLAVAQDITNVEWSERGGMVQQFRVFAAMAPRLKADKAGQSGIVHYAKA